MATTNQERQAAFKAKMRSSGKHQTTVWVDMEQHDAVKAYLQGDGVLDTPRRPGLSPCAECQAKLAEHDARLQARGEQVDSLLKTHEAYVNEVIDLKRQLATARRQPRAGARFKIVEMENRRQVIANAMHIGYGGEKREPYQLKQQVDLAKKLSAEIKAVRTRLLSFASVAAGTKGVEKKGAWGVMSFRTPILSESESLLLLDACALMNRIEADVERASHDTEKLHKQREAELKAMHAQAQVMLNSALFSGLNRRGEALFVAAAHGGKRGFGDWGDLLDLLDGKADRWCAPAHVLFGKELNDQKGTLTSRLVDKLKTVGMAGAEEYLAEVISRFRHPDTEEKYGEMATRLATLLVAEQIEKASKQ